MMSPMRLLDEGEPSSMTPGLGFTENKINNIGSMELDNSVIRSHLSVDDEQSQVSMWAGTLRRAHAINSRLLPASHMVSQS